MPSQSTGAGCANAQREARRQRARLRVLGSVALFYLLDGMILALFAWQGVISYSLAVAYGGIGIALCAMVHWIVRKGWNLKLRNANFTFVHVLLGTAVDVAFLALAPEAGFVFILSLFVVGTFGSLELSMRQFTWWWITTGLAVTLLLFAGIGERLQFPTETLAQRALVWLTIVYALARFMLFTGRMGELRAALHQRNQELKESMTRIEQLANVDELTQVWNRRALMRFVEEEVGRAERTGSEFCLALIDLDHFKRINDTFGHPRGDQVLKEVAAVIATGLRTSDRLGRFGGEEFVCVLVDTSLEGGRAVLERVRSRIAHGNWDGLEATCGLTLSAGLAARRPGENVDALLERADAALYQAKRAGRNRLMLAAEASTASGAAPAGLPER
jgi:diguanylate cyclase